MTGAGRATTVIVVLVDAALVLSLVAAAYGLEGAALPPVLGTWVSLPYVVAGIAIARRPPAARLGRLMVIAGIATLLGFGIWSPDGGIHTLGLAVEFLPAALLLHLFLGYPTGTLGCCASGSLSAPHTSRSRSRCQRCWSGLAHRGT